MSLPINTSFVKMVEAIDGLSQKSLPFIAHHYYNGEKEHAEEVLFYINQCRLILELEFLKMLPHDPLNLGTEKNKELYEKQFKKINSELLRVDYTYESGQLHFKNLHEHFRGWRLIFRDNLTIISVQNNEPPLPSKRHRYLPRPKKYRKRKRNGS